jgi:hypothetical protein
MEIFNESSVEELYSKTVLAFPKTTKRQHATHPIVIEQLRLTPFVGMKTLFIKGLARNEERSYNTIVLFKNVDYGKKEAKIIVNDQIFEFNKLSLESTDVLLRCNCNDFKYRFSYYNHLDKSLYGRKPAPYESKGIGPPANPMQYEGMCKHLIKTIETIRESYFFLD